MTMDPKQVRNIMQGGGVYVLTGVNLARGRGHREIVEAALEGGARLIQLRDKLADDLDYYELARVLQPLCERHQVPFIVNDRADVALAVGAEGVHVGQEDVPVAAVRALARASGREDLLIGLSTHNPEQGTEGARSGADYLGVGPIYPTRTKDYCVGIDYVRWASEHLTLPWTVSGGVDETRLVELAMSGAQWIVVIEAVNADDDMAEATRRLKVKWDEARAAARAHGAPSGSPAGGVT